MRRVTRGGAPTGRLSCFVSHVNGDLIAQASIDAKKGYVDATHPQVVIFEPETSGAPHPSAPTTSSSPRTGTTSIASRSTATAIKSKGQEGSGFSRERVVRAQRELEIVHGAFDIAGRNCMPCELACFAH